MAATETARRCVAYIFQDVGGWYICDDAAGYLDTRGKAYRSKNAAIAAARWAASMGDGYTHYRTGGGKARKLV